MTNDKFLIFTVALLLLLLLIWINRSAARLTTTGGNDRFGLAFVSAPDDLADARRYEGALATGARWDRWPLYWHWVAAGGYAGPHEGGRHDYDILIAQDIQHGFTPLVILMGTPAEEARSPAEAASAPASEDAPPLKKNPITVSTATLPPQSLDEPIFADGTDEPAPGKTVNPANAWAMFVFETVNRYRPGGLLARRRGWSGRAGVRYWEIWNEPDFDSFWGGSVAAYERLLEVAYKSVKAADPQATVLLGGLAFYEKPGWFPELLRQSEGGPVYFDAISMHHYWSIYNSEARLLEIRAALETFGRGDVPIWITESGVSVWDDYPATAYDVSPETPWRATTTEQAAYVIQHAALAFYHDVERYYHFLLHDDCGDGPSSAYGLRRNFSSHVCNPAEGRPRPAYAAYQLAAEQFAGVVPLWRERAYETDRVAFYRPHDQARVVALWAAQGFTVTTTLPATGRSARLYWIDPAAPQTAQDETARRFVSTLTPVAGVYNLTLPPATNQNAFDPGDASYHIGGPPYLLIERDTLPPEASVDELPPASPPMFLVRWSGEDSGSGVAGYEVWVSQDEGPFERWLAETTATRAEFSGRIGHTYGFAVRARDRAGNEQPQPVQPQAATGVVAGEPVTGVVLNPAGEAAAGATVVIEGANIQRTVVAGDNGQWPAVSLAAGAYTFQAEAPGYAAWPAPRSLEITASTHVALTLAPSTTALAGGDFEDDQVWRVWDWAGQVNLFYQAFDGRWAVRLGQSQGEATTCPTGQPGQLWFIRRRAAVPPDSTSILSFVYTITSSLTGPEEGWFDVALLTNGTPHYLIPPGEVWRPTAWTFAAEDVSAWQGQTVTVQFRVVRCSEQPFKVALDRVSLG